jgi:hypothetical protein
MSYPLLHEVEAGQPERELPVGPAYCAAAAVGGVKELEGVKTCYDLWE